ncbi:phenyltransferase domain-containing protein [Thermodesulfobacteriota bacterium]
MVQVKISPIIRKPTIDISPTAEFIASVQRPDGEIPWSQGGKTDPWDHVESAMALTIGGRFKEAHKAYLWSKNTQLQDGSWWSYYTNGSVSPSAYKDTNMTAYIAVGVLHYYLATGAKDFLRLMWPTVCKAMDYVIALQGSDGQIFWAKRSDDSVDKRALLTGSSSIYKSLVCALKIASILGEKKIDWKVGATKLGEAIREKPQAFDQSKSRYSMDWYYPVLSGAITGEAAQEHLERSWRIFTITGCGVRCVADRPWVTMAETAELVIALTAMGNFNMAEIVFNWIVDKKYDDGAFWTGINLPDRMIYTREKTTWTSAAVLLAADILYEISPACRLFDHHLNDSDLIQLLK